ncbi:hypothetical protein GCM10009830_07860 [Glycomyces endophyticus]|uniref:Nucleotidyltransferase family protein n=1 Tax=Glycomyces endophyticus TaxID=480996 RepID=A0ABP4S6M3_9ACTN
MKAPEPPHFPGMTPLNLNPNQPRNGRQLIELVWWLVRHRGFDPADFVIAGSAWLFVTGHRTYLSDIDILARGTTWLRACELAEGGLGKWARAEASGDMAIRLYGGLVEVFNRWILPEPGTDQLIDSAEFIDGLPFMQREEVVRYKRFLDRDKDQLDLAVLSHCCHNRVLAAPANPARVRALGRWKYDSALWRKPCHALYRRTTIPRSKRSGGNSIIPGR